MQFIIILFLLIVLLLEGLVFVVFTPSGNKIITPYINSYLKVKVPAAKIELIKLQLKPSSIGLIAKINDAIDIKAAGDFDILSQNFDITYIIDTNEIKTPTITIKEHVNIKGTAKGNLNKIKIFGNGSAFESDIKYDLGIIENNPQNINIDIEKANLSSLLAVAGQKPYAGGQLTLHANMPKLDPSNPVGTARLDINKGHINTQLVKDDFNITLPPNTTYHTNFIAKTNSNGIVVNGELISSIANLLIKDMKYNLSTNDIHSDYALNVKDLKNLKSLTGTDMKGLFKLKGNFKLTKGIPTVTGNTQSFGGDTSFVYSGDTLNATLKEIQTSTLLYKIGQPKYLGGKTNANISLSSIKNLSGKFSAQTKGNVNTSIVKKDFDLNLGKKFYLNSAVKGNIKSQNVLAELIIKTTMANIKASSIKFNISKASLHANYLVDIPNMGKLKPITGKEFKGDMRITGDVNKGKDLVVSGHGKEFGGSIDFKLFNEKFKADVKGATVSKVMHMLDYPQVLEAVSRAKVNYNTKTSSGTMEATLDNARILPNKLTEMLKQYGGIDLTNEKYNNSKFIAKIQKNIIAFSLDARNKNNYFLIKKGVLDKLTGAINATVDMKIKGKDLKATIRGTTDNPKISLDASEYLKGKLKDKLLKSKAGKKAKKLLKKKLKSKTGQQIKNLTNGLF